jgi:hypothetical protein
MALSDDVAKLNEDMATFLPAAIAVREDLEKLQADMSQLQATGQLRGMKGDLDKINWQGLICTAITTYNAFAVVFALPVLPLPNFCKP